MSRVLVASLVALLGCRSQGTITMDFTLAATSMDCGAAPQPRMIVYAEPRTFCSSCACGECLGIQSDDVVCGTEDSDCAVGESLDLQPGHWAVVMSLWNGSGPQPGLDLVASECIDVDVGADGVESSDRSSETGIACAATCTTGSSPSR